MNEEDEFLGCISCMSSSNLFDLFSVYEDNGETYASMFKTCFAISLPQNVKFLCSDCAEQLEKAFSFKEQTGKSLAMLKEALAQDEEYLDEKILEEDEPKQADTNGDIDFDDKTEEFNDENEGEHATSEKISEEDESKLEDMEEGADIDDSKNEDDLNEDNEEDVDDPQYRAPVHLKECDLCGVSVAQLEQHQSRCHGAKAELDNRKYPCHFCENVYISKKACFTHLRMKHGLKLCTEQTTKFVMRERKKCHLCSRDFSQKQILNKHLWKAHGLEVEKRKAFICPLCSERVSYGSHFSAHLLHAHRVHEHVEQLHFHNMDDFLLFKSAVQEETKFRYRKTTASKQTIEGVRSHYMCSQSGVYVYQGKGKRPAPERQIYKTGKACPAHMIVTEKLDHVLVTFYKTHVGHGPCPYFEPRELKKPKIEASTSFIMPEEDPQGTLEEGVICDACGLVCPDADTFRAHAHTHDIHTYTCQYCTHDFQDIQAWTYHMRVDHNMAIF